MFNPVTAEAVARALIADRLTRADAARRAQQARRTRRSGRRHQAEVACRTDPSPSLA